MTTSTSQKDVGGDLQPYDEINQPPLVKMFSVRLPAPTYARLVTRALCERNSEGSVLRRWLWRGAMAEGIDLLKPL